MRRPGLRTRIVALFAAGALVVSATLAVTTFEIARSQLLSTREHTAVRAAYADAGVVQAGLSGPDPDVLGILRSLDTGSLRRPAIRRAGQWYARTADSGITSAVPRGLLDLAASGRGGLQRVRVGRQVALVVAVPLRPRSATYVEVVDLEELQRTLGALTAILALVALATAGAGAGLGWWAARRVLRPLASVAAAATTIGAGDLSARIDPAREPDLARLAVSFNEMVDQLALRMERDRRFAADVSHELRSPLQTLSAATSVLQRRAGTLDERSAAAVALVASEVERFSQLVTDLLELARGDRPAERVQVDVRALVQRLCTERGVPLEPGPPLPAAVDPRRLQQVLANLLDNAERHGGGPVAVRVVREDDRTVVLEVDDDGPGVPEQERTLVFDRFARGRAAGVRGGSDGTGLGLALVAQHAQAHDGRACVGDRPGGGARFRVELHG